MLNTLFLPEENKHFLPYCQISPIITQLLESIQGVDGQQWRKQDTKDDLSMGQVDDSTCPCLVYKLLADLKNTILDILMQSVADRIKILFCRGAPVKNIFIHHTNNIIFFLHYPFPFPIFFLLLSLYLPFNLFQYFE